LIAVFDSLGILHITVVQSTEFDIDKEYVSRVVGAHGTGINRLRDQLGVKVDVSDDVEERERESNKKKKAVHQKSRVKVLLSSTFFVLVFTLTRLLDEKRTLRKLRSEFLPRSNAL
jgi:predicted PilT family ATPase